MLNWQAAEIDTTAKVEKMAVPNKAMTRTPAAITNAIKTSKEHSPLYSKANNRLEKLESCITSQNCPYSHKDSRSYSLQVFNAIASELEAHYRRIQKENIIDERISALARKYMSYDSGHIKEKCLNILSTQQISIDNLNSILNETILYHSDKLIEQAMMELRRYKGQGFDHIIENYFEKVITTSSPSVRESLTKQIIYFIDENNYERFKSLLNRLPPSSNSYGYLKAALERFFYR